MFTKDKGHFSLPKNINFGYTNTKDKQVTNYQGSSPVFFKKISCCMLFVKIRHIGRYM